jgi:hypothetical protein
MRALSDSSKISFFPPQPSFCAACRCLIKYAVGRGELLGWAKKPPTRGTKGLVV